jgi:hypothetical protein
MTDRLGRLLEEHRRVREQAAELCEAARTMPELDPDQRAAALRDIVTLLHERVLPHIWIDERVLYPEIVRRLGDPLVTASMNYDHRAIRRWIDDMAASDARNGGRVQQLLYGLSALITVHVWKEDELYVAALESQSWPALASEVRR